MKLLKKITVLMMAVLTISAITLPVSAQNVSSAGFTVKAVIPENQTDMNKSYFDLRMTAGQVQTLNVDVINSGSEEITIDIALRAASTNRNAIIEYQVEVEPDETLKIPFDTIAKSSAEVKVAAGATQRTEITVTMPAQQFDGAILGGIVFTKRESTGGDASGVSVNNRFSYVVGVKLTETDKIIGTEFRLKTVEPMLVNYRRAVVAYVHNPVPVIVKGATVTAYIYKGDDKNPLHSISKTNVDMAPNSVFPMSVEWDGNDIEAGDYRLVLKISNDGNIWDWDEPFTIDQDKARDVNDKALDPVVKQSFWQNWWWILLIIIIILLLVILAFLLGRRTKDNRKSH